MPAEWSLHDAVWTAWPHDPDQWLEGLAAPQRSLMKMIAAIVDLERGRPRGERVELLVRDDDDEAAARQLLGPAAAGVRFHHLAYGDVWLRDTGPIFVTRPGELAAVRFQFDGWGGKYLMEGDTEVAAEVIERTGVRGAAFDFVLEGGAIEVDGEGTVLTTRQCLLGGARNPGLDQRALGWSPAWRPRPAIPTATRSTACSRICATRGRPAASASRSSPFRRRALSRTPPATSCRRAT